MENEKAVPDLSAQGTAPPRAAQGQIRTCKYENVAEVPDYVFS